MSVNDAILNGIFDSTLAHHLHPTSVQHLAREWLREDPPNFDYGGFVVGEREQRAVIMAMSAGVLAGRPFFDAVFKELDCTVEWFVPEGKCLEPSDIVANVTGKVRQLLLGERVSLSCICRASGIATAAERIHKLARSAGYVGDITGTHTGTPGFRLVEQYALSFGGASALRHDITAMIILNDNHIRTAGSVTQAVKDALVVGHKKKLGVECRTMDEASEAAESGCDIVILNSQTAQACVKAAMVLKQRFPDLIIQACGRISEDNITQYFSDHIDVIATDSLTQGSDVLSFVLKIVNQGKMAQPRMFNGDTF